MTKEEFEKIVQDMRADITRLSSSVDEMRNNSQQQQQQQQQQQHNTDDYFSELFNEE